MPELLNYQERYMSETYERLKEKLDDLKANPPWLRGTSGEGEGSRAPWPGEYVLWIGNIALLEAEIGALQLINRP